MAGMGGGEFPSDSGYITGYIDDNVSNSLPNVSSSNIYKKRAIRYAILATAGGVLAIAGSIYFNNRAEKTNTPILYEHEQKVLQLDKLNSELVQTVLDRQENAELYKNIPKEYNTDPNGDKSWKRQGIITDSINNLESEIKTFTSSETFQQSYNKHHKEEQGEKYTLILGLAAFFAGSIGSTLNKTRQKNLDDIFLNHEIVLTGGGG